MNKQRKTSHILNVFQYDETTGAVTLPAGLSLPTPDSTDNSTKVATTAWIRAYVGSLSYATASSVTTAIANLVASAPTTLDTLNELATALGNDPNFATTITTSIGTKVPQSRTITINGTAYDLSANRSWTIASGVTSFNTRTGAITLTSGDVTGALGYTPVQPNGTGASGTWGISISGNAATATSATTAGSADNIDGWSFVNTGSNSGTNADTIASNGISYVNASAALLGQTDGALYSQAYNSNWQHQVYGDYRTGQLVVRGKNSGTWQAWRTILDSSNSGGVIGPKYQINDTWLRVLSDTSQFQIYGNSRTLIYRTDGNTNPHGGGGYAHLFYYGGSADAQRVFIINTDGRLYSPYHGWLDTMSVSYASTAGSANSVVWSNVSGRPTTVSSFSNDAGYQGNGGQVNNLSTNYAGGVQSNPQVYFNNGIGLKVAMTGYWSVWSDTLWVNGYAGGDVPWMCALHFLRNSEPRFAISAQTQGSGSYGSVYEVMTDYNIGSRKADGAKKLWAASHPNDYYIVNNWTGSYWQLTTNHGSAVQVGYSDNSGTASNLSGFDKTNPSFGAVYANNWFRAYGDCGLYQQDYGGHFRRNTNSYGNWEIFGYAKNGYTGIVTINNYVTSQMHNSSGDFGFLTENGRWWNLFYNNGNNCWGIGTDNTYSGDGFRCIKYGSAEYGWTTWSDRRAKENISTITGALDTVLAMRGVYFNYIKDEAKNKRVGFIAQELEQVLPEAVRYAEEIDEYSVEYAQIVSVLAEAIKEQDVKMKAQDAKITRLEALVEQLTNN